jgi:transposase
VDDPRPPSTGQPQQLAARYRRHGALQLLAALSVADGLVYGQCRARKRFVDFQEFFLQTVVPEAQRRQVHAIRLILDHGPTHAPKRLETWLADQHRERHWPFTGEVAWLPKYASWLDQIELWFSILQRKVLTPNHFVSLEALRQRILGFIQHHNHSAKPIQWSYTVEKLERKFATN